MPIIEPDVSDVMPFRALETELPNGLRVIIVPTGFPNLVSVQIPVKTGSRNEVEPGKSGFAHFFEHMMFRGTRRFPADRYQEVLTRAGARQNAYTTDDYTNYHITFAREDLETILDLEADRFMNLEYSEADFRTEARAILGEYNKSASDPLNKLLEVQRENAFTTHTYKHTTMGFIVDIEAMPEQFEYSRTFFRRWYRPEHTAIIVAGDVEPDAVLSLIERYWGAWEAGGEAPITIPAEPDRTAPVTAHLDWPAETLPWVSIGFLGPGFSDTARDYAALDTVLDLFFGETSDIYQDLVERRQLVDQLFAWGGGNQDPALFTIFARLKSPADAPAVRDAILGAIAEARRAPVSGQRLEDAKSNMRYGFARTLDNSESIAATLARFVRYDRSYMTLNTLFRTYASLGTADLHMAARTYLTDERAVLTTLSHEPFPAGSLLLPSIGAAEGTEEAPPRVNVVRVQSPSPLLRFKLVFRAGSAFDPPGREGLASLSAAMVAEAGSERLRIDEINRALFPLCATFTAQVDKELTTFTGVAHRDTASRFLDTVLPQLLSPGFREDDFARLKENQINALVQDLRASNEEELGKERLQANLFAGTPYGHTASGTVAGIGRISVEDVRTFANERFTRQALIAGITGDVAPETEHRLLRALDTLPAGQAINDQPIAARRPAGIEIEIIAKETRSTAISFGHPIEVTRAHPDFAALWLGRAWLGEHRASNGRLFQRLREVRGLNYGNYAYIEAFPRGMHQFFPDPNLWRRAQLFEVWIRPVAPEHAVFALKAGLFELRGLLERGLSTDEFETTRAYLSKNVYVMTKTQDQQLGAALDATFSGTGDFVQTMQAALRDLTVERVNAALRRHLSADNVSVVMITKDAEALRQELLAGGLTAMSYESPKADWVVAEDREIGAIDLRLNAGQVRITPLDDVFAR